jgi:hypothetical protein
MDKYAVMDEGELRDECHRLERELTTLARLYGEARAEIDILKDRTEALLKIINQGLFQVDQKPQDEPIQSRG